MKTNEKRAENILRGRVSTRIDSGQKRIDGPRDELRNDITAALDKAEKRGKRNEKQWWRERWQNRNKDIIQHIEQQCVPPQFDAEKMLELILDYANAKVLCAKKNYAASEECCQDVTQTWLRIKSELGIE